MLDAKSREKVECRVLKQDEMEEKKWDIRLAIFETSTTKQTITRERFRKMQNEQIKPFFFLSFKHVYGLLKFATAGNSPPLISLMA